MRVESLTDEVERLWQDPDTDDDSVKLEWSIGDVIERATSALAPDERDALLRHVADRSRVRHRSKLTSDQLTEMLLIRRTYPDGPPPLSWRHLRRLTRIPEKRARDLYEREAVYRSWSDVELHARIRSGIFDRHQAPDVRWKQPVGTVVATATSDRALYVVEHASNQEIGIDGVEARVAEIDPVTGARRDLGDIQWRDGYAAVADGALYVSSVAGLLQYDGRAFRVAVASTLELATPPLAVAGRIISIWNDRDDERCRVTIGEAGGCRWGEPIPGRASAVAVAESALLVRVGGHETECAVLQVDLEELRVTRRHAVGRLFGDQPFLARAGQLLIADVREFRTGRDEVLYEEPPSDVSSPADDRWHIASVVASGVQSRDVVACFDAGSLERRREWRIAERPESFVSLPEDRGLVVTGTHAVWAITPFHARPVLVGRWRGAAIGPPVRVDSTLVWLVDRCEGRWSRSEEQLLEVFDCASGEWSFVPLALGQIVQSMHACGDVVILVGSKELVAFGLADLLGACLVDPGRTVAPLSGAPDAPGTLVSGLPLAGPKSEAWAARVAPDLALELLPVEDRKAWARASGDEDRFDVWQRRVSADCEALLAWPSAARRMAEACPAELLDLTNRVVSEDRDSPALTALDVAPAAIRRILAWKRSVEGRLETREGIGEARRRARVVLYEYAMRCRTERTVSGEGTRNSDSLAALSPEVREAVAWLNLGRGESKRVERVLDHANRAIDLSKLPLLILGPVWAATMLLGDRLPYVVRTFATAGFVVCGAVFALAWAALFVAVRDNRRPGPGSSDIGLVAEAWPDGCPPLVAEPDAFVRFVQHCVVHRLLSADARSPLQRAVATAWEHPDVTRGAMVFISYSSKQAELAQRLGESLRARGVETILDRYELTLGASDAVVEMWIAESLMRCTVLIHLVSDDVSHSGWVHRESEWQLRLLGVKRSLVLPILVTFGRRADATAYPPCRVVNGTELLERWDVVVDQLTARVVLDWLLMLRSAATDEKLGIAHHGKQLPIRVVGLP